MNKTDELINGYKEVITSHMNIDNTNHFSVDLDGNFSYEENQASMDTATYYGKVIDNGLIAVGTLTEYFKCDLNDYKNLVVYHLVGFDVNGYSFLATVFSENNNAKDAANKELIENLYNNYNLLTDMMDEGLNPSEIKRAFNFSKFDYSKEKKLTYKARLF